MFFRLRQNQANNIVLLCIILMAWGMILEIKVFYLKHQKQLRLSDYNKQVSMQGINIDFCYITVL